MTSVIVGGSLPPMVATNPHTAVPTHLKLALSVREVAEMCSISTTSVDKLIAQGVLPRVPHTGRVLVPRTAVERWVNSGVAA